MKNECLNCACVMKSMQSLKSCQLEQLESNHAVAQFHKGDPIIKQGMFSTNVVFLKSGLVKIHITGPYREQIVRLTKAPTYLGLPTTIGDKINQYSVTAVADSEVCFIDVNVFKKLLDDNHDFSYQIILDLCRNELESFRRCANRTQRQSRGNIAAFLLELSNDIAESNLFVLPLSQNEIGNLVDTTRENVSRILAEFDKDQIISLKGKNVEILNKNSLELISKNG